MERIQPTHLEFFDMTHLVCYLIDSFVQGYQVHQSSCTLSLTVNATCFTGLVLFDKSIFPRQVVTETSPMKTNG